MIIILSLLSLSSSSSLQPIQDHTYIRFDEKKRKNFATNIELNTHKLTKQQTRQWQTAVEDGYFFFFVLFCYNISWIKSMLLSMMMKIVGVNFVFLCYKKKYFKTTNRLSLIYFLFSLSLSFILVKWGKNACTKTTTTTLLYTISNICIVCIRLYFIMVVNEMI